MEWPTFTKSDSELEQLVKLSRFYGNDSEMVIAGGGNTSVKNGDRIWVKGSGTSLGQITPEGFVELPENADEQEETIDLILARHPGSDNLIAAVVTEVSAKRVRAEPASGDPLEITGDGLRGITVGANSQHVIDLDPLAGSVDALGARVRTSLGRVGLSAQVACIPATPPSGGVFT